MYGQNTPDRTDTYSKTETRRTNYDNSEKKNNGNEERLRQYEEEVMEEYRQKQPPQQQQQQPTNEEEQRPAMTEQLFKERQEDMETQTPKNTNNSATLNGVAKIGKIKAKGRRRTVITKAELLKKVK